MHARINVLPLPLANSHLVEKGFGGYLSMLGGRNPQNDEREGQTRGGGGVGCDLEFGRIGISPTFWAKFFDVCLACSEVRCRGVFFSGRILEPILGVLTQQVDLKVAFVRPSGLHTMRLLPCHKWKPHMAASTARGEGGANGSFRIAINVGIFGYRVTDEFDANSPYRRHGDVNIVDAYRFHSVKVPPRQDNRFALQCDGLYLVGHIAPTCHDRVGIVLD